jgi:uncharacterized protein YebE (UPF0316 family)
MVLLLLCVQVFCCRIVDVSLGTVRTIMTVKGKIALASVIGFVEVFVWFVIVRTALDSREDSLWVAIAYAGGFATGTYTGGALANRFMRGFLDIQIVTSARNSALIAAIRDGGFAVSVLNVNSSQYADEKYMLVIEIRDDQLDRLRRIVRSVDPDAFIMARETKLIYNGFFK